MASSSNHGRARRCRIDLDPQPAGCWAGPQQGGQLHCRRPAEAAEVERHRHGDVRGDQGEDGSGLLAVRPRPQPQRSGSSSRPCRKPAPCRVEPHVAGRPHLVDRPSWGARPGRPRRRAARPATRAGPLARRLVPGSRPIGHRRLDARLARAAPGSTVTTVAVRPALRTSVRSSTGPTSGVRRNCALTASGSPPAQPSRRGAARGEQGQQEPTVRLRPDRPLSGQRTASERAVAPSGAAPAAPARKLLMILPCHVHRDGRTSARRKNAMFAGRSASRRIRYPYHCSPYGT